MSAPRRRWLTARPIARCSAGIISPPLSFSIFFKQRFVWRLKARQVPAAVGMADVRNAWTLLSGVLETAVEYGYLTMNPARRIARRSSSSNAGCSQLFPSLKKRTAPPSQRMRTKAGREKRLRSQGFDCGQDKTSEGQPVNEREGMVWAHLRRCALRWATLPVFMSEGWRRRPDLNRGWRFCRPLPYLLATAPRRTERRAC
jgi:hypothetical protein